MAAIANASRVGSSGSAGGTARSSSIVCAARATRVKRSRTRSASALQAASGSGASPYATVCAIR